jgi:hypothetical protein
MISNPEFLNLHYYLLFHWSPFSTEPSLIGGLKKHSAKMCQRIEAKISQFRVKVNPPEVGGQNQPVGKYLKVKNRTEANRSQVRICLDKYAGGHEEAKRSQFKICKDKYSGGWRPKPACWRIFKGKYAGGQRPNQPIQTY